MKNKNLLFIFFLCGKVLFGGVHKESDSACISPMHDMRCDSGIQSDNETCPLITIRVVQNGNVQICALPQPAHLPAGTESTQRLYVDPKFNRHVLEHLS